MELQVLRILNFITDEKFIDTVIYNHDLVEDNVFHIYVLILKDKEKKERYEFSYIQSHNRIKLLYQNEILDFIKSKNINSIILHSLFSIPAKILPQIDVHIPILWVAWGYDLYQRPIGKPLIDLPNLYMPITKKFFDRYLIQKRGFFKHQIVRIRDLVRKKGIYKTEEMKQVKDAIKRINFFSGIIDLEYTLLKSNLSFKVEESVYAYSKFQIQQTLTPPNGNNILLGNSANMTNNHLDILDLLKNKRIIDTKVFVPLNYGGDKEYIATVVKNGKELIGTNFEPLVDFIDFDAYKRLLSSCSSIIIGAKRQQAMGNIDIGIRNGAKIFLYKDSILYQYLMGKGYIVFSIEEELNEKSISEPLSKRDMIHNFILHKKIMSKKWNYDTLKKIYSQFRDFNSVS